MGRKLQLGALLAVVALAAGCAPAYYAFEEELEELRALVESANASAGQAVGQSEAAAAAAQAAEQAQAAANEALAAANAAQAAVDATNERMDRMFEDEAAK